MFFCPFARRSMLPRVFCCILERALSFVAAVRVAVFRVVASGPQSRSPRSSSFRTWAPQRSICDRSASQVTAPWWVTPTPRARLARARGVPIPPRARRDRPVQKHRAFCRDNYELNTNDRRWRRMRSAVAAAAAAIASGGANGGGPCPLRVG